MKIEARFEVPRFGTRESRNAAFRELGYQASKLMASLGGGEISSSDRLSEGVVLLRALDASRKVPEAYGPFHSIRLVS